MTTSAVPSYAGYRFPAEVISHAVWLYFRFPLSLRMVDELLAARGIIVSHETVRQWALKFGQAFACQSAWKGGSDSISMTFSATSLFLIRNSAVASSTQDDLSDPRRSVGR